MPTPQKKRAPSAQVRAIDAAQPRHDFRVWIELERPKTKEEGDIIAAHANRMLQRLSPGTSYKFWWNETRAMWDYGHLTSYRSLRDNGEWLSLSFVGREIPEAEQVLLDAIALLPKEAR